MCLSPSKIADVGFVACRECWQCKERRIDDWVGRNIAESKTAKASHVVTLTYGEDRSVGGIDHLRASVLTYSDVQKYFKYLRVEGFPVRYFAVGEYGSKKGRAHWHVILYWQKAVPAHSLRENFTEKHWTHGLSYWDGASAEAVRYACKYLQKAPDDEHLQGFGPMPSKKPPLGDAYFRELASRYVEAGIAPQDAFYSFPDVRRVPKGSRGGSAKELMKQAKPIQFHMRDKTAENFCRYFVESWREKYQDEPPQSPFIWAYLDKGLRAYVEEITLPQFNRRGFVPVPDKPPPGGTPLIFDEIANCWWSRVFNVRLWYSYDTEGDLGWHEKIKPDPKRELATEIQLQAAQRQDYLNRSRGH